MAGVGSKLISSKKSKLLSANEPSTEAGDAAEDKKEKEVTSVNVRKAKGGFIVDCDYGMKPHVAKDIDAVMELLKEYLG